MKKATLNLSTIILILGLGLTNGYADIHVLYMDDVFPMHNPMDTLPDTGFGEPLEASQEPAANFDPFKQKNQRPRVLQEQMVPVDTSFFQLAKIPKSFTGFKIELMNSQEPLPKEHDIFFRHGNLSMEKISDTKYSYTLGTFHDNETALLFMQDFLIQLYPKAQVIEYADGERLY
jgi:hypothetical protein